mmetsp:Transcript_52725/g.146152  ORF Transcript_52725/g.146152 Transcript_52725/m.146152 type:complete len:253 (-) Transcript_52725:815-1573(-)
MPQCAMPCTGSSYYGTACTSRASNPVVRDGLASRPQRSSMSVCQPTCRSCLRSASTGAAWACMRFPSWPRRWSTSSTTRRSRGSGRPTEPMPCHSRATSQASRWRRLWTPTWSCSCWAPTPRRSMQQPSRSTGPASPRYTPPGQRARSSPGRCSTASARQMLRTKHSHLAGSPSTPPLELSRRSWSATAAGRTPSVATLKLPSWSWRTRAVAGFCSRISTAAQRLAHGSSQRARRTCRSWVPWTSPTPSARP